MNFKGGKTFYLIEPNETNINLFEKWSGMTNNTEILFSDQVSHCYCIELKEGNTIFLPSGKIKTTTHFRLLFKLLLF